MAATGLKSCLSLGWDFLCVSLAVSHLTIVLPQGPASFPCRSFDGLRMKPELVSFLLSVYWCQRGSLNWKYHYKANNIKCTNILYLKEFVSVSVCDDLEWEHEVSLILSITKMTQSFPSESATATFGLKSPPPLLFPFIVTVVILLLLCLNGTNSSTHSCNLRTNWSPYNGYIVRHSVREACSVSYWIPLQQIVPALFALSQWGSECGTSACEPRLFSQLQELYTALIVIACKKKNWHNSIQMGDFALSLLLFLCYLILTWHCCYCWEGCMKPRPPSCFVVVIVGVKQSSYETFQLFKWNNMLNKVRSVW